jgi:hypothetical protein
MYAANTVSMTEAEDKHGAKYGTLGYLLALVSLLIAYLVLQIALNPEIGILPPSITSGRWILAPFEIAYSDAIGGTGAIFTKQIIVPENDAGIESALIRVTAARHYELRLNGNLISGPRQRDPERNWKTSQEFNLRGVLHAGSNLLEVVVRNTVRQPALLASGAITLKSRSRIAIDSNATWHVLSLSRTKDSVPEMMPPPRDFYPGHLSERKRDAARIRVLESSATIAAYLVLALAIFLYLRRARVWRTSSVITGPAHPISRKWIFVVLFIALYFPMSVIRDPHEGWDADGHIEHLRYVAAGRGVPMPDQGWEMYQPPLYYWLASAVYRAVLPFSPGKLKRRQEQPSSDFLALKAVQLLTPIFALLHMLVVLKLVRHLFPNTRESFPFTVAFVMLMPMQIYFNSFISNESFSAFMISVALFLLVLMVTGPRFDTGYSAALGITMGLACLSKYTGFLVAMTAGFVYGVFLFKKLANRRQLIISFLTASLLFLALAGPFYFRNIKKYGKPLPLNTQFVKHFPVEYFDLAFLIDPLRIGHGAVDKYLSREISFIDGNYSSMWLDHSHVAYPWTRLFEVLIYYLAIFPTLLIAVGFLRAIAACRKDSEMGRACLTILAVFSFANCAYLYFILRYGGFEGVKAFYLLSMMSPIAVFFEVGRGAGTNTEREKTVFAVPMVLLYTAIAIYYLLVPFLIGKGY